MEMARGIGAGVDDSYIHGSAGARMEVLWVSFIFLCLADKSLMILMQEEGHDKLVKVRYFLSTLIESYQNSYKMEREISVDEMMI